MKVLLLLLAALCGVSMAIQYPLSYEYMYSGEVKTGIHELRNQYAGAALKAKVKLTVVSSSVAHVQISEARVGTVNGDVPAMGRAPLPISNMQPIKDLAALEKSFSIHFSGQQEKLEVPRDEMLWMSNLRKSVISLLRVPYVLSAVPVEPFASTQQNNLAGQEERPRSFKKDEDTVLGKCKVTYTLTKAAPRSVMQLRELEEDVEPVISHPRGRSVHASPSDRNVYRMVRSLDFNDCRDRVVLLKASHGNMTSSGKGQLRGVQTRSSVGEYILMGTPSQQNSMRVEKAVVEGIVSMNPFGHETKKIMTVTNQTLELIKTTHSRVVAAPSTPMKEEHWAFRVSSPYKRASSSPSWISFLGKDDDKYPIYPEKDFTGYQLTTEMKQRLKNEIIQTLESVREQLTSPNSMLQNAFGGSKDGASVQKMDSVVSRMRALPYEDLRDIYMHKQSHPIKKQLVIGALKASGSSAAIKVLLEEIKKESMSLAQAANVFTTMTPNMVSSSILKELMDYAMSLQDNAPVVLKSSVLINLSNMLHRMCLNEGVKHYSFPIQMMGEFQCPMQEIRSRYIPYLQSKVKSVNKTYLRGIYIQALANLGVWESVKTLGEIAEGQIFREEPTLRLLAIDGLSKSYVVNTSYPLAEKILLSIAEEQVERPVIREAAIKSLFSLPKNATLWHRMALSTWREPSRRVASFIYSIVRTVAQSKDPEYLREITMAKHVLPQMKPQAYSPYYSIEQILSGYDMSEDIAATFMTNTLASETSIVPQEMITKLVTVLGGMRIPLYKMSTVGKGMEVPYEMLMDIVRGISKPLPSQLHEKRQTARDAFEKATEGHRVFSQERDVSLFVRFALLKHIQIFAPLTHDSISELKDPQRSIIASVFDKLVKGEQVRGVSYYNPVDVTEIIPSEIGLPIITQISQPTMLYTDVVGKLESDIPSRDIYNLYNSAKYVNVTARTTTKIITKRETSSKILVPWMNKTLVTGVDGETTFSVPSEVSFSLDNTRPETNRFQFTIRPNLTRKSTVLMTRNLPFTLVRELLPVKDVTEQSVKPINVLRDAPRYRYELPVSRRYTGMELYLNFKGDTDFPINSTTFKETILQPVKAMTIITGPTTRQYEMELSLDLPRSAVKQVTTTVTVNNYMTEASSPRTSQVPLVPDLSADDSVQERMNKIRRSSVPVYRTIFANLNLTGSEAPRKYEVAMLQFIREQPNQPTREQYKFQIDLSRNQIPNGPGPAKLCTATRFEYPLLRPYSSLREIMQRPLYSKVLANIYSGQTTCTDQEQILHVEGYQRISEERKQHIREVIESSGDRPEVFDTTEAVKSTAVYDRTDIEINFLKPLSPVLQNVSNHLSDFVHGIIFPLYDHNTINVPGKENVIIINATRSLATDRYTVWTHEPHMICLLRDVKVAAFIDYSSALSGYLRPSFENQMRMKSGIHRHIQVELPTSDKCVLKPEYVKSFAGVHYEKKAMKCDVLAVKSKKPNQKFVIMTKEEEESPNARQEIKIIYPEEALDIKIKSSEILVNDNKISEAQKEVKNHSGKIMVKVSQSPSVKKIEVPHKFSVELKEGRDILIQMDRRFRSQLEGLCGKFGSDNMVDLQDSHKCLYKPEQGKKYAAAWIASSELEQCKRQSSQEIKSLINRAEEYQTSCPKSLHEMAKIRLPSTA